ncbi:hypothetical protein ACQ86O_23960 [Serratia sp. L9]|uniref:hypothetical protein n=1 Tax=Serratia sp. L9 TaxID=3423946 RepID=UPI003D66D5D8
MVFALHAGPSVIAPLFPRRGVFRYWVWVKTLIYCTVDPAAFAAFRPPGNSQSCAGSLMEHPTLRFSQRTPLCFNSTGVVFKYTPESSLPAPAHRVTGRGAGHRLKPVHIPSAWCECPVITLKSSILFYALFDPVDGFVCVIVILFFI